MTLLAHKSARLLALACLGSSLATAAQTAPPQDKETPLSNQGLHNSPVSPPTQGPLRAVPALPFTTGSLTLTQSAIHNRPFTVTGTGGAILGMQDGTVELWQFPLKFFSGLHLRAEVDGYPVPIDLNSNTATLQVSPDHATLTYSHAAITVKQHMLVPAGEGNRGLGGIIVFEIHSIAPATLTVSLNPAMILQWPAPQYGQASWDWIPSTPASLANGPSPSTGVPASPDGLYGVFTDNPELWGLIALPTAAPGAISPYQEHPRTLPLEFRLRFDPRTNAGQMFPLLCEVSRAGERNTPANMAALKSRLEERLNNLTTVWSRTQAYYAHYFDTHLITHTPDPRFDRAMSWAELAIDKAQVATSTGEVGLVAGWFPSFDSARPGFGWFFGRDTLWSLYAIDGYGDQALARRALDFLIARQRADGKMMHEYSQSADQPASLLPPALAWANLPYEYAAADATPLYLLAMQDYIRTTGDLAYLKAHWDSLQRAYRFERTHDSDGDGVYDNSQGTGWVEDWARMPHQELYLAALDRDATAAMAQLAAWVGDTTLTAEAQATAAKLTTSVEAYGLPSGQYAFSKNLDGTYDPTVTVYPSVALWGSDKGLARPATMLRDWSSHLFETDWGTRAVSIDDPTFNAISYHRGSVWPLFTGWTSMAQYRAGHPLAGYAALNQNINLTEVQDPGSITEVLSGRFYQPLGRSSTHQLWSSAMIIAPALKGLFGLEPDAPNHLLLVHPHLPATWDHASLDNVRVGETLYMVTLERRKTELDVIATGASASTLCLRSEPSLAISETVCKDAPSIRHELHLSLPPVEVQLQNTAAPLFGEETRGPRAIDEHTDAHSLTFTVEALAGSTVTFTLRRNTPVSPIATGAEILRDKLIVSMPPSATAPGIGPQFVTRSVTLRW